MGRKRPAGPHAEVAERFAFLLDAVQLDRDGFVAAVDGAVTSRSLFAILSGDRRPSRSLAVLIERTFGFRADHLLQGTGPMWAASTNRSHELVGLTDQERQLVDFARRSVDNARILAEELARAQAWEAMWGRAMALLANLERLARAQDASSYPEAATQVLEECWHMADAFSAWTTANDRRRVVHLTRLFVQRFLLQVPDELAERGAVSKAEARSAVQEARQLQSRLDEDADRLDKDIARTHERIAELTSGEPTIGMEGNLAARLGTLVDRIDRLRPSPA